MSKRNTGSIRDIPLKISRRNILSIIFYLLIIISPLIIHLSSSHCSAQTLSDEKKRKIFESKISSITEQYVGIPYRFGGNPERDGKADNSHLFCMIFEKAARESGLKFRSYMPMQLLLNNAYKVSVDKLRKGDLVVLNDGHAALIYKLEGQNTFHLIYASFKRQEVISFNSRNVIYDAYWLKNLRGFFRLNEDMFVPIK